MEIRRDKFLSFARRLALLTPALAACGGSTTNTQPAVVTSPSSTSSGATSPPGTPPTDATAGSGPCRCSWDTNGAAAPRVCKKGQVNYEGSACIPGGGTSYGEGSMGPVPGPLPPPDLSC